MASNIDLTEPLRKITSSRAKADKKLSKAQASSDPDGVPAENPVGHTDTTPANLSGIDGIEFTNVTRRPANRTDLQDMLGGVLSRNQPRGK